MGGVVVCMEHFPTSMMRGLTYPGTCGVDQGLRNLTVSMDPLRVLRGTSNLKSCEGRK